MAYYALDNPGSVYNYDCAGSALVYNGYANDELALESPTKEANTRVSYYDDNYIYAN